MPDYRFVVNLRSDTFAEPFRESIPTPAYLLAADHAAPAMRDLASGVRDQGLDPFADNGNFELVGKTESHLWDRARGVLQKVRTAEDALGHRARRGDLPAPLRKLGAGIGSKSSPANQSAGAAQRSAPVPQTSTSNASFQRGAPRESPRAKRPLRSRRPGV